MQHFSLAPSFYLSGMMKVSNFTSTQPAAGVLFRLRVASTDSGPDATTVAADTVDAAAVVDAAAAVAVSYPDFSLELTGFFPQ